MLLKSHSLQQSKNNWLAQLPRGLSAAHPVVSCASKKTIWWVPDNIWCPGERFLRAADEKPILKYFFPPNVPPGAPIHKRRRAQNPLVISLPCLCLGQPCMHV